MYQKKDALTDLAKKPLSFIEAATLAKNLETIEQFRELQRKPMPPSDPDAQPSIIGRILLVIVCLSILYAFGSIVWATISVLFSLF